MIKSEESTWAGLIKRLRCFSRRSDYNNKNGQTKNIHCVFVCFSVAIAGSVPVEVKFRNEIELLQALFWKVSGLGKEWF